MDGEVLVGDQYASDWDESDIGTEISGENSGGSFDNTSRVTEVHPSSPTRCDSEAIDAIDACTEEQVDETIKLASRMAHKDKTPLHHDNPDINDGSADQTLGAVTDMSVDVGGPGEEHGNVDGTPDGEECALRRTSSMGSFIAPLSEHNKEVDTFGPQVRNKDSAHNSICAHSPSVEDDFAGRGSRDGEGRQDSTQEVQEVLRVKGRIETSSENGDHGLRLDQGRSRDSGTPTMLHKAKNPAMLNSDAVVPHDANTSSPIKISSQSSQQPTLQKTTRAAEDGSSVGALAQTVCRVEMVNQDVTSLRLEQSVENALLLQGAADKTSCRIQDGVCSATSLWSLSLQRCRLPSLLPVAGLLYNLSVLCSLEVNGCTGLILTGLERVLEDAPCLRALTLRRCGIFQFQPPLASGSIEVSQSIACVRYQVVGMDEVGKTGEEDKAANVAPKPR